MIVSDSVVILASHTIVKAPLLDMNEQPLAAVGDSLWKGQYF